MLDLTTQFTGWNIPEACLNGTSKSNEHCSANDSGDIVSSGIDDGAQDTQAASTNHEPSTTEDIAQSSDQSQPNTRCKCLHRWNKDIVGVWTYGAVYDPNRVGWQNIACERGSVTRIYDVFPDYGVPR